MMKNPRLLLFLLLAATLLQACGFPAGLLPPTPGYAPEALSSPTQQSAPPPTLTPPVPTASASPIPPSPVPSLTPSPAPTSSPTPITYPEVTFASDANCRLGPARNYFAKTSFLQGRVTKAEGRNQDASWLWVLVAEGHCWISVSTVKDPVSYFFLPLVEFPLLPEAPTQVFVVEKDCSGRNTLLLRWTDVNGESSYVIYRDGITLATIKADATEYFDYPPDGKEYLYEVQALNDYGASIRYGHTVQGCQP